MIEIKKGYKQTELGVIPKEWDVSLFIDIVEKYIDYRGRTPKKLGLDWGGGDILALSANNVQMGKIDPDKEAYLGSPELYKKWMVQGDCEKNDVLLTMEAPLGNVAQIPDNKKYILSQRVVLIKPKNRLTKNYLAKLLSGTYFQNELLKNASGSTAQGIQRQKLDKIEIFFPRSTDEQTAIATVLSDTDAFIEHLGKLIAKKKDVKQGTMQELLTGKKRLPGFSGDWEIKRIAEIATPSSEKNTAAEVLPVLTCSKHLGFVDSLGYFKNQIFSKDTSTYKIIQRGQIGYPANHVEEGSIGLQNLYQMALVSPIYVVFAVNEGVNSYFLHRVLKLDSYRQKFKTATTSSVDRRGSLRWSAFSEITVNIPPFPEQTAIAAVLSDMDAEIKSLEQKWDKYTMIKLGMMQELLTGKTRLI